MREREGMEEGESSIACERGGRESVQEFEVKDMKLNGILRSEA